ncbi:hypothetical protein BYT27DRAFT_7085928 [Phlegmacium glaucopus]|nr:hypothetical protein BYT27DRAFT_7085928 [Phlegmacium glaucopus]
MLVNECYQEALIAKVSQSEIDSTSERAADIRFNNRIGDFRTSSQVPCVKVSTDEEYPGLTLEELVNITRNCLHEVEGDLWILWATTQQISAQQKIERSISQTIAEYWLNLGRSSVFQDHYLIDCLRRIHDDILKIWNFHDPDNLLSGDLFFAQMIRLVEPLLSGDDSLSQYSNMMSLVKAVSTGLAHVLGGVGIGIVAFKFLYGKYQKIPLTAGYLGAYIVDLLLVLHRIFTDTLHMDPPRPLSQEIISGALESHKDLHAKMVHDRILAMTSENHLHLERKIGDLIQELLNKK